MVFSGRSEPDEPRTRRCWSKLMCLLPSVSAVEAPFVARRLDRDALSGGQAAPSDEGLELPSPRRPLPGYGGVGKRSGSEDASLRALGCWLVADARWRPGMVAYFGGGLHSVA